MNTTLNKIRACSPCEDGWKKLLNYLGKTKADNEQLSFKTILESNGIQDAVWCLRTLPPVKSALFSAEIAESVLPLFEKRFPEDDRPRKAIETLKKFSRREASEEELKKASEAAYAASAYAAYAASAYAAAAAAYAAYASAAYAAAAYASDASDAGAAADAKQKFWDTTVLPKFKKHFC